MAFRPLMSREKQPGPTGGSPPYVADASDQGPVLDAVVAWHDRNHSESWAFCSHELCNDVRGRTPGDMEGIQR